MLNALHHFAFIGPGGPELIVVMLVLLLMFGAQDAPRMLRKLTEMLNQLRSTAENFKREVMYSDLFDEPKPDRSAGEYDDYGVGYADDPVDTESPEGSPPDAGGRSDSAAEPETMSDAGEGEGGDVQKN
jgi:Sec-independent protein translocase protein TatA